MVLAIEKTAKTKKFIFAEKSVVYVSRFKMLMENFLTQLPSKALPL